MAAAGAAHCPPHTGPHLPSLRTTAGEEMVGKGREGGDTLNVSVVDTCVRQGLRCSGA